MPSDPRLNHVIPANQQHLKQKVPRTKKQETAARTQSPVKGSANKDTEGYGITLVDPEIIESQMLKGLGSWHPDNIEQIPLAQLERDVEVLTKAQKPKPSLPTVTSVLSDFPDPYFYYAKLGGQSERDSVNIVDAFTSDAVYATSPTFYEESDGDPEEEGIAKAPVIKQSSSNSMKRSNPVPMRKVAEAVVRNVTKGDIIHEDRLTAYCQYFEDLVSRLRTTEKEAAKLNKALDKWNKAKAILDAATDLYLKQRNYEHSLSDQQRIVIAQADELLTLRAELEALKA